MAILDLIFPTSCLTCKKGSLYFCPSCLAKVEVLNHFNPFTATFSVFRYEGVVRQGIIKLKYNFASDLADNLSEIFVSKFRNPFPDKNILLVPIPLHKTRQNWRGFNQSEILGKLIAQKLNWHFRPKLLIRTSQGKTQVGLKGFDRVRNIRGKFAVNSEAKLYQTITYIIFDDVATTGSTLKEAIKVLKEKGAQKVFGLTIAK